MHPSLKTIFAFTLPLIVFLFLIANTAIKINPLKLSGDGEDNFKLSYHLAKKGIISTGELDATGQLIASNAREPLPIILSALWIKAIPALANASSAESITVNKKITLLKLQNVVYIAALLVGIFCLFYQLLANNFTKFKKVIISTAVVILCFACMHIVFVNNLITEFHAELLIIWFLWAWLYAWETKKTFYYVLAGFLLGLLILTKAAFMYIGLVSLLFFMAFLAIMKFPVRILLQHSLILILAAICVAPWFIRNYIHFGVWEHTQRGPVVLLVRAYKNAMSHEEFKGAFYAYAPISLKKLMQSITGFSAKDRLTGGRLQRLTRFPAGDVEKRDAGDEKGAISYYMQATTHDRNLHRAFYRRVTDPIQARILGDQAIKQEALQKIRQNIPAHLKAALVFAWRGAWPCNTVDGRWKNTYPRQPMWQEILPFFGLITMWGLFIVGALKRQAPYVILSLLGVSTFTFYALSTHFLPRYSEMMISNWVICFALFAVNITQAVQKKWAS